MEGRRGRDLGRDGSGSSRPPEPSQPPRWRVAAEPPRGAASMRSENSPLRSLGRASGDGREGRSRSGGWKEYPIPSRPEVKPSLGRTSGVAAAGAWAARWEIASMLEARCDPAELVSCIQSGKEGEQILNLGAGTSRFSSMRSVSPTSGGAKSARPEAEKKGWRRKTLGYWLRWMGWGHQQAKGHPWIALGRRHVVFAPLGERRQWSQRVRAPTKA